MSTSTRADSDQSTSTVVESDRPTSTIADSDRTERRGPRSARNTISGPTWATRDRRGRGRCASRVGLGWHRCLRRTSVQLLGRWVGRVALEPRPRGPRSRARCIGRSAWALRDRRVAGHRGRQGSFEPGHGGDAADGLRGMVRSRTASVARALQRRELFRGVDASAGAGVRSGLQHRDGPDPGDLRCLRRWLGLAAPAKGHGCHRPVDGRLGVWPDRIWHLTENEEITNARERARSVRERGPRVAQALRHAAAQAGVLGRETS